MSSSPYILSSGLRISRNGAGMPFPGAARSGELEQLRDRVSGILAGTGTPGEWEVFPRESVTEPMGAYLVERGIAGRSFLMEGTAGRAVGIFRGGRAALEMNNTDHFRMFAWGAGEAQDELWALLTSLDDVLGQDVPYAFQERWGYLTARPREAGTGLRARATLLLPVLMVSGGLADAASELNAEGLMMFPVLDGAGGVFQVSALGGRGTDEVKVIHAVKAAARRLAEKEQALRQDLLGEHPVRVRDYIGRALGVAQQAWSVGTAEAWTVISATQLGTEIGILEPEMPVEDAFALMQRVQTGHIMVDERKVTQGNLEDPENDIVRGRILRSQFAGMRARG